MSHPLAGRTRGDLLIVLAAFIWGVAFYFQKVAMTDMGPLLFLGLRGGIAMLVLLPFALREHHRHALQAVAVDGGTPDGSMLSAGLLAGLVFFLAAAIQQTGIVTATVTNTGFLTALYVVVTPFLFWAVRRKRPGLSTWMSVVLASAGVWALGGGGLAAFNRGDALVACSSVFWALLIIISGESARFGRPLGYTCIQFAVVAILGLSGTAIFKEVFDLQALLDAIVPLLYVGILSSACTFGLMAIALQQVPAPRASILLSLETVFAAMAAYLFLGERMQAISWLGAGLIVLAVLVIRLERRAR